MIFAFLQRTTTSFAQTMRLIDVQIKVIPQKYKPKSVFHNENCKEMKTRKTVAPQWMNLIAIKRTCIRYTAAHFYMNISVLLFFFYFSCWPSITTFRPTQCGASGRSEEFFHWYCKQTTMKEAYNIYPGDMIHSSWWRMIWLSCNSYARLWFHIRG